MKKIGRILSLIVCFQLAWGCQSNAPVSESSSGPAAGYTELSGSVTLAFMKVSEMLIPSAAAQELAYRTKAFASKSSGFSAEGMSSTILESCNQEEVAVEAVDRVSAAEVKVGAEEEAKKVARLVDYSDLSSPCLIKEIELNLSADGETATYNVQIENELVEDKVVALVYGDEEKGVYKNAIFSIEKGDRVIKQHLDDESSVKAEILGTQILNEVADVEFTDEVKSQIRDRIKELKKIEDFGLDLLGDKEKMISILKDPNYKNDMINALIEARSAKEAEGETDAGSVSSIYSGILSVGSAAAENGSVELKQFLSMECSPDHVFIAKYGDKEYQLKLQSSNKDALGHIAENFGYHLENGILAFKPMNNRDDLNRFTGEIFRISRVFIKEFKDKVSFKLIISDPEKKEADRSCNVTVAPPTLDFKAVGAFDFKSYATHREAMDALNVYLEKLKESFQNKLALDDGQVDEEEVKISDVQFDKLQGIGLDLEQKIFAYFKSSYASKGLGIDIAKLSSFNFKVFKTADEARTGLSEAWNNIYNSFQERINKKLEAKEISQQEYDEIRNFQIHLGKEQHHKIYLLINAYFHGLNVSKELGIDLISLTGLDYKSLSSSEEAHNALNEALGAELERYKQMMKVKLESNQISPEVHDQVVNFENDYANNMFWKIYNEIDQYFNSKTDQYLKSEK